MNKFIKTNKKGFSILELLVAMTVLSILVVMMTTLFNNSITSFNIGTQRAEMNLNARAFIEYISRELSSAIAGPIIGGTTSLTFEIISQSDICFLTDMNKIDTDSRNLRAVYYWLQDNAVYYGRRTTINQDFNCYHNNNWSKNKPNNPASDMAVLISNVWDLRFDVYTTPITGPSLPSPCLPNTTLTELPYCIDIMLQLLADDDMKKAQKIADLGKKEEFVNKVSKVYTTRIYFKNKIGYLPR